MINLLNVTKSYGKQTVLKEVNFQFPTHGLLCLLGASGCGKSTLLNLVAGLDRDYSGHITVCGTQLTDMSNDDLCVFRRNHIGFIFQNYNLLPGYTVLENILLSAELNTESISTASKQAKQLLLRLDMMDKVDEKVQHLSGGQKQRTAIARALINHPSIILADEPTGALDRTNANEIMTLLQEISKDRLVLVITHDPKICEFADTILSIKDGKLIGETTKDTSFIKQEKAVSSVSITTFKHGLKNFLVHQIRYIAISIAISIGVLAFMLSLSSGNIMSTSIIDFKAKNTAFMNGYIKNSTDAFFTSLKHDVRVEHVYKQYIIKDITLLVDGHVESMAEKYPMPKATEKVSYGHMPYRGKKEISLSPSLARKFSNDLQSLVGKEVTMRHDNQDYKLTISGIFNADYDDFFVSSDIEQRLYPQSTNIPPYSITYDVKNFEDVVPVHAAYTAKGAEVKSAASEVATLQNTFQNLRTLFLIVSILMLFLALFISSILLVKLQNSRYSEVGLLSALGYQRKQIKSMMMYESILLAGTAILCNMIFVCLLQVLNATFGLNLMIPLSQLLLSALGTGISIILISVLASHKLLHTDPSVALRK